MSKLLPPVLPPFPPEPPAHRPLAAPCAARRALVLAGLAWPLAHPTGAQAQPASAPPPEVGQALPQARLQGGGRLTFLGLHVYDARLWAGPEFKADSFTQVPLALELEYARTLYGRLIAERSIVEMKKVGEVPDGKADAWQAEMTRLFADVGKGDRLTGVQVPGESVRFFLNGRHRGDVRDAEFVPLFFGIWLSPRSSEPKLRTALLGGGKPGG